MALFFLFIWESEDNWIIEREDDALVTESLMQKYTIFGTNCYARDEAKM